MKTHGRTQAHDCIGMEATGTKIPGEPEHTSYRYCLLGALTERARDLHEHDERDFPIRPPRAKVRNTLDIHRPLRSGHSRQTVTFRHAWARLGLYIACTVQYWASRTAL